MKVDVPFFKQTSALNCGPCALKMVLAYFGEDVGIDVLEERVGIKEGKGVSMIQMAIASRLFGYKTQLFSTVMGFNGENKDLEFYKKYVDDNSESEEVVSRAKELGVELVEKGLGSDEILGFVGKDSLPIVLVDWNVFVGKKEKGYQGHFVPVVGYDDENVYVHNHGMNDSKESMAIKKDVFDEARKAQGTDEDVLVVWGKV
ncbi:MAG: peptidase C39 family protein [archaeon]